MLDPRPREHATCTPTFDCFYANELAAQTALQNNLPIFASLKNIMPNNPPFDIIITILHYYYSTFFQCFLCSINKFIKCILLIHLLYMENDILSIV